jgi:hypothetical protein
MTRPIESPQLNISVEPARGQQTPQNDLGSMLKRGTQRAFDVVASGARAVAPFVPGGAFISAVADVVSSGVGNSLTGSNDKWALLRAQERLQDEGLNNSLRLLALQRKMHQENQAYTATSNVMKARHEMAKSAINNIR